MSFFSDSLIKKETFWFEQLPLSCYQASGIVVNGRRIKSLVFTTDLAIIRNCDADAVFAVYPFTPQSAISHALINGSYIPVFCGCGGGTTKGLRTLSLAQDAEGQGAMGIVLNAPISDLNLLAVTKVVDIPVIITVVSEETDIAARLASGASILNVAAGPRHRGAGTENPPRFSGGPDHRERRQYRREHSGDHCGRRQCHHLHTALHRRALQKYDGQVSRILT